MKHFKVRKKLKLLSVKTTLIIENKISKKNLNKRRTRSLIVTPKMFQKPGPLAIGC